MTTTTDPLRAGSFAYESDDAWAKIPPGYEFPEVAGVAVDSADNVYLFNRGPHPVIVLDKEGNFRRSFGEDLFAEGKREHAITISPDNFIYLVDDSQHCVHKFDMDGNLVWTLGESGKPAPKWSGTPFNRPTQATVSPKTGEIFVTDGYGNSRVHRYTPDGRLITSWGGVGSDPGEFLNPHNVVIDADDNVFVADRENSRVQVFDVNGKLQAVWNNIYRADGMCMGADGTFYIGELNGWHDTNSLGHRLSIFSKDGKRLARLGTREDGDGPGSFIAIHGVAVDSMGNVYMGEVSFTMKGRTQDPPRTYTSFRRLKKVAS